MHSSAGSGHIRELGSGPALRCVRLPVPAGSSRLALSGELDLVTADRARRAVLRAQAGASTLTVDLGGVWFLDLAGLRVLLDAAAAAQAAGGRLTIVRCPPIVPRMLALLELEDALDIQPAPPPVAVMASYRARARSRAR